MAKVIKPLRLRDLAHMAGVSVGTASMALGDHPSVSPETRDRVKALAAKMGYKSLRRSSKERGAKVGPASRIGFIFMGSRYRGEGFDGNAAFIHRFMAMAAAQRLRFEVAAIENVDDRQEVRATLRRFARGLDGLMLETMVRIEDLRTIQEMGLPCIVLGQVVQQPQVEAALRELRVQRVEHDGIEMGRHAASWLVSHGHKRIAFISEKFLPGFYHSKWLDGYWLAHRHADLQADVALIHASSPPDSGVLSAHEDLARLDDPPTAYVIPDGRTAASFLDGARRSGREIDPHSIVFGSVGEISSRFGLDHFPRLEIDTRRWVSVSLALLLHVRRHPPDGPLVTVIPHTVHNMD